MFDPRKRIVEELRSLFGRTEAFDRHLRNADGRIPEVREDWMEVLQNDEVVEALDDVARKRIPLLLAALDRVAAGTYGLSELSGDPIDPRRLEVLPEATLTAQEALAAELRGEEVTPVGHAGASLEKGVPMRRARRTLEGESPGPTGSTDTRTTIPAHDRVQPEDGPMNRPEEEVGEEEGTSPPGEMLGS